MTHAGTISAPARDAGDLSGANSLRLPATAERLMVLRREADVDAVVQALRGRRAPPLTVLGGGSNVVLRPRIPGIVCLMKMRGVRLEARRGSVRVTAAAGERWHDLVRHTLGQGLWGLENLALIPGSVGAAPIQNVGAYGVELAERFVRLRALDVTSGRVHTFDQSACEFTYRDSRFRREDGNRLIILDVTLELERCPAPRFDYPDLRRELVRLGWDRPSPVQVAEAVVRVRRRKLPDPRHIGNAGSFFKNPVVDAASAERLAAAHPGLVRHADGTGRVKLAAAQLIERCGWKARRIGAAAVWHRQPLVLVNRGGATAADLLTLSERIRRDVRDRFDVALELEPRVVGHD